jgi:hypothetical protein
VEAFTYNSAIIAEAGAATRAQTEAVNRLANAIGQNGL